jgi:ubiquinol-cytochrome c reductase cytochrome c subunit
MNRLVSRWWHRRARTPWQLRALLAICLGTLGLLGIAGPASKAARTGSSPPALSKKPDAPGPDARTTTFPSSPSLIATGKTLYQNGCASCHGALLQGRAGIAPSLYGVGAGPVDFYVSTGRMPLQAPTDEPLRARAVYDRHQVDALIAYIVSVGGGPAAPAADPSAGNLSTGLHVFTENCAGCHQVVARGGMTIGAFVPNLQRATARQVAEAVRMGPYLMPRFDSHQIDQDQLDSVARYVLWTRNPSDAGGWGLYNLGPIPEGLAAWFIALLALLIVARLIGERMEGAKP